MLGTVYPHRVIKVAINGQEERVPVGSLQPCETCAHPHDAHPFGKVCVRPGCGCLRYKGHRVIGETDVTDAARAVAQLLEAHGVDLVRIEHNVGTGDYAEDAQRIASAIETALSTVGIPIESIETKTTPKEGRRPVPEPHVPPNLPPAAVDASRALAAELAAAPVEPPAPRGPRVGGIDPGAHWVAVTVAEGEAAPLAYVASRVFDVGRLVALPKPKVTKRKDGTQHSQTHRRVIEDEDVDALLADVLRYLRGLGVERVVVERATHFYGSGGAQAAGLARAQWVGGELAGALRVAGARVETVSSATWRGAAKKSVRAKDWRAAVVAGLMGWPSPMPGEHAVDAAGAALYAVTKPAPKAEPKPKGPTKPRRERSSADAHAARAAKRAADRAAKGCKCQGRRRHAKDCPARVTT